MTGGMLYVKHSLTWEIVHAMDKQASPYNSEYKLTQTGNQYSTRVQPMLYMYANSTSTIYDCFKMRPSFWGGYTRDKKNDDTTYTLASYLCLCADLESIVTFLLQKRKHDSKQ